MTERILLFRDNRSNVLKIRKKDSIPLELKLNLSKYGKAWRNIGDILYNFGCDKNIDLMCSITNEQYDFLDNLNKK